jgi:hypothetical protein
MAPRSTTSGIVRVCIEATDKRAFASAVDWPGWCRSGRDDDDAVAALADHADRYRVVARAASVAFAPGEYAVIERLPGTPTTTFGAPAVAAKVERDPLPPKEARRVVGLVAAAWSVFDAVVAKAPPSLRKGPRGGGRDRDQMVQHVLAAEHAYAAKVGVRSPEPRVGEATRIADAREAILDALRDGLGEPATGERRWLPRYAARRIAWHVLDHAWEIENRTGC